MKAVIYFEQIGEEKHDVKPLLDTKKQINYFIKKYPDTDYAIDLRFKKDLINNQLAAKELYCKILYFSSKMDTCDK